MTVAIKTYELNSWIVAQIAGRVDAFNDKRIVQALQNIFRQNRPLMAVDLSQAEFISFFGMQELLKLSQAARSLGGEFVLVGPTAQVRRHLDSFAGHRELKVMRNFEELQTGLFFQPRSEFTGAEALERSPLI